MRIRTYGIRSDAEQMATFRTSLGEGARTLEAAGKHADAMVLKMLGEVLAQPSDEADKAPGWQEAASSQALDEARSAIRAIVAAAGGALERGASPGYLVDILEGVRQDAGPVVEREAQATISAGAAVQEPDPPVVAPEPPQEAPAPTGRATPPARQR